MYRKSYLIIHPKFFDNHKSVIKGPLSHGDAMIFLLFKFQDSKYFHNLVSIEDCEKQLLALFQWMKYSRAGDVFQVSLKMGHLKYRDDWLDVIIVHTREETRSE